ncbi:hypothetical protein FACS189420_1560 [Bacteroidia bacterium]|nr:hypothetical protein FACS189420_1560 [Bacteroidia bacterium]
MQNPKNLIKIKVQTKGSDNMNFMKYVIGLDYGTDSARAVIVEAETGKEIASSVKYYKRWK